MKLRNARCPDAFRAPVLFASIAAVMVVGFALWGSDGDSTSPPPLETAERANGAIAAASTEPVDLPKVPEGGWFADRPFEERMRFVEEIRKLDLNGILDAWFMENNDLSKKMTIGTILTGKLREQTMSPQWAARTGEFIVDTSNPQRDRMFLLGNLAAADTLETIELCLHLRSILKDEEMHSIATDCFKNVGNLIGDGRQHLERSPPLERAWIVDDEKRFVAFVAVAIAKIAADSGIELLFASATGENGADALHRAAATGALSHVYMDSGIPAAARRLGRESGMSQSTELAAKVLVNIASPASAKALVVWLRVADDSVAPNLEQWLRESRSDALRIESLAVIDAGETFRSHAVLKVIMKQEL